MPEPTDASSLSCPQCGSDAFWCDKSDHGAVDGPAMHCHRSPYHNDFDPSRFAEWGYAPVASPDEAVRDA